MQGLKAYLDNSATTQVSAPVIEAMRSSMTDGYFNPSALYTQAVRMEMAVDDCRQNILKKLARPGQIIFTSGGTEANNLAILGSLYLRREKGTIYYFAGEHPSVIESCHAAERLEYTAKTLPMDVSGRLDVDKASKMLGPDTAMICLMQINNETGAVQPVDEVVALRDRLCPGAYLHVDGVQGFLKQASSALNPGIDSYSLSGHKLHGPKGVGALYVREGHRIAPILFGGGQEKGLRSGTENTPGIAGLNAAIQHYPGSQGIRSLKLRLYEGLKELIPKMLVNGPDPDSPLAADHILNVSFPPVRAETMLHALEGEGILVGNGSACSSRRKKASHVLEAMGIQGDRLHSAIRFSLSVTNTQAQIDQAVEATSRSYELLKNYRRR